ncbi:MAG: serine hydrolase [Candidatus Eremiobacteraeota bacterium]|nr:serine hydrolase [Candidatus Eremiobacteraeota bacterium]
MNRSTFISHVGAASASAFAVIALRDRAFASALDAEIGRAASASSGEVAVYARRMGHPAELTFNADERFPTASIIKVVIMVSLFQLAEKHPGVMNDVVTLKLSDFVGGSEILDGYNPGNTITVDRLARAMIEQSDNTASNVLISYLGFERIKQTIASAGLTKTQLHRHFMDVTAIMHHSENLSTARDMGSLLYQVERGAHEAVYTVASPQSCRAMIGIMLRQEDRDKIARGLPAGVPLANKTGEIDGVRNDIGIVDPFGEAPYVIAVLTKDLNDFSLGNIAIRRISKAVHSAFV